MKLLLTSNGLSNQSIANALIDLVGKPANEISIAFIPTAMNVGSNNKGWVIRDLSNIQKQEFKNIDIVDISALPQKIWLPRLEAADVLFFSGGNSFHLMRWIKESGLINLFPELLKTRVYAGISAGSVVTNPTLAVTSTAMKTYYEENFDYNDETSLNWVNFFTRPHFNSPNHPEAQEDYVRKVAENLDFPVYALDDNSALKVIDGTIEVISEGKWLKI